MRILVISVNIIGVARPIVEEMRCQGHEVIELDNGEIFQYHYLSKVERATNFFAKSFWRRNLKNEHRDLMATQFLRGFLKERTFDLTIITNPYIFGREHLALLKQRSGRLVCHLWDSLDRLPENGREIDCFDQVLSFDPKDIQEFGFTEVSNFYSTSLQPLPAERPVKGDLFGIFSFDRERYRFIQRFLDANPQLQARIIMLADHPRKARQVTDSRIEVVTKPILGEELAAISSQYRAVLDVGYATQKGLSLRFFDALGYEQKLVTTNEVVKGYPFYNPDNIFCVSESRLQVPETFFLTPYQRVPDDVKLPYRLDNWVKNLLSLMMA